MPTPQTTSCPCRLRLIPAAKVVRFAVIHQEAVIQYYPSDVIPIDITPASLKLSERPAEGSVVVTKSHTFRVPAAGRDQQSLLDELSNTPLVALYRDEHGREKVSGSPFYPLTLTYQPSGGTYSCTLAGKCTSPDLFVAPE